MRLFPRLLMLGAVLPSVSAAVIFLVGIELVSVAEHQQLDRALLSQAAVEAVSLFDGPRGLHLHMASSPLLEDVAPFAPEAAVYAHTGERLLHFPDVDHRLPSRWAALPDERTLNTSADGQTRELVLPVQHRDGTRYWLVLSGSRASFHHGGDGRGVGLGLAIVQEVARRHGGDVFVVPGVGGRVGFRVPV